MIVVAKKYICVATVHQFTLRSLERYSTRGGKPRGCLYNRWNNSREPSLTFVAIITVIFFSFPL